jgi:hypothetical protein
MQMREVDTYENVYEVYNYFRQSNVETFTGSQWKYEAIY